MLLSIKTHWLALKKYLPALFFLGGFVWDALTIGKSVQASDLWILGLYLLASTLIIVVISQQQNSSTEAAGISVWWQSFLPAWLPYFLLQFLFGSMLSPLFILYFKSAGHIWAWLMVLLLAWLLVLNEFLENHYRKFTLVWAMYGLCSILLLNFALPFTFGSISSWWFYASTIIALFLVTVIYTKFTAQLGRVSPVYSVAGLLTLAYSIDVIPPVPLVKRDIQVAYDVKKQESKQNRVYVLTQEKSPWWSFWSDYSNDLVVPSGGRVYCFSSVFAPNGLQTLLIHDWQRYTKNGWVSQSKASFRLNGGRDNGYRGYTFKSNPQPGSWRVRLMSESGKTLALHTFDVTDKGLPEIVKIQY